VDPRQERKGTRVQTWEKMCPKESRFGVMRGREKKKRRIAGKKTKEERLSMKGKIHRLQEGKDSHRCVKEEGDGAGEWERNEEERRKMRGGGILRAVSKLERNTRQAG